MANVISDRTARSKFDQILRQAVKGHTRFVIEKEGKPQVVILGIREYIKMAALGPEILSSVRNPNGRERIVSPCARSMRRLRRTGGRSA